MQLTQIIMRSNAMKRVCLVGVLLLASVAASAQTSQFTCSDAVSVTVSTITTAGNTQIVAAPNLGRAANLFICSYSVQVTEGATPYTFQLVSGSGTNCATATAPLTVSATGAASSSPSVGAVFSSDGAIKVPANAAVCLSLGGVVNASSVNIRYMLGR